MTNGISINLDDWFLKVEKQYGTLSAMLLFPSTESIINIPSLNIRTMNISHLNNIRDIIVKFKAKVDQIIELTGINGIFKLFSEIYGIRLTFKDLDYIARKLALPMAQAMGNSTDAGKRLEKTLIAFQKISPLEISYLISDKTLEKLSLDIVIKNTNTDELISIKDLIRQSFYSYTLNLTFSSIIIETIVELKKILKLSDLAQIQIPRYATTITRLQKKFKTLLNLIQPFHNKAIRLILDIKKAMKQDNIQQQQQNLEQQQLEKEEKEETQWEEQDALGVPEKIEIKTFDQLLDWWNTFVMPTTFYGVIGTEFWKLDYSYFINEENETLQFNSVELEWVKISNIMKATIKNIEEIELKPHFILEKRWVMRIRETPEEISDDMQQQLEQMQEQMEEMQEQMEEMQEQMGGSSEQMSDPQQQQQAEQMQQDMQQQAEQMQQAQEQIEDIMQDPLSKESEDLQKEIDNLEQTLQTIQEQQQQQTEDLSDLAEQMEDEKLKQEIEDLKKQMEEMQQQTQEAQDNTESIDQQAEQLSEAKSQEQEQINQDIDDLINDLEQLSEELSQLSNSLPENSDIQDNIDNLQEQMQQASSKAQDLSQQNQDMQDYPQSQTSESMEQLKEQINDAMNDLDEIKEQIDQLSEQTEDQALKKQIEDTQADLEQQELEDLKEEQDSLEELSKVNEEIEKLKQELEEQKKELEQQILDTTIEQEKEKQKDFDKSDDQKISDLMKEIEDLETGEELEDIGEWEEEAEETEGITKGEGEKEEKVDFPEFEEKTIEKPKEETDIPTEPKELPTEEKEVEEWIKELSEEEIKEIQEQVGQIEKGEEGLSKEGEAEAKAKKEKTKHKAIEQLGKLEFYPIPKDYDELIAYFKQNDIEVKEVDHEFLKGAKIVYLKKKDKAVQLEIDIAELHAKGVLDITKPIKIENTENLVDIIAQLL
jgi:hypothetical protein